MLITERLEVDILNSTATMDIFNVGYRVGERKGERDRGKKFNSYLEIQKSSIGSLN